VYLRNIGILPQLRRTRLESAVNLLASVPVAFVQKLSRFCYECSPSLRVFKYALYCKPRRKFFPEIVLIISVLFENSDSSVGIATRLRDGRSEYFGSIPGMSFSLHHRVQTGSGVQPASYPMGTRGSFPGGKAGGA
jgi:hypothetical protein